MGYLKDKILDNIKYKSILVILLLTLCILVIGNVVLARNISLKDDNLYEVQKMLHSKNKIVKVSYSKIIDALKKINGINVLNIENDKTNGNIMISIEIDGNGESLINTIMRIEKIEGFYSIDNIKIDELREKTFVSVINVKFRNAQAN